MQCITDPETLRARCFRWRCQGLTTALVPTMGAFHPGHASLMRWARENADRVVVSLFVNPAQFGPGEDLAAYPREPERDRALAEECGTDALFMPAEADLYAPDHATWVDVPGLSDVLCGRSRPTHFRGVCTVVCKLLLLTLPSLAVFGRKDWQQLAVIRCMARDLLVPTRIVGRPIVREPDGLAMSSRNAYLTSSQREQAPNLYSGLVRVENLVHSGCLSSKELLQNLTQWYAAALPEGRIDYLELVDPDSLQPVTSLDRPALLAVAVYLGRARLIDNILLYPPGFSHGTGSPPGTTD
ncbi:MAG: pantoate--beta-alanine ligase [Desulfohalobiaceae bacterium]